MQQLIRSFAVFISLFTATGVFIHDGRIDKAATAGGLSQHGTALVKAAPGPLALDIAVDPHVHPEHGAKTLKGFGGQNKNPSYPPRVLKIKRFMQQNIEPRGRHAFDNYHLPVIS